MAEKVSSIKKRNWTFVVYPTKEQLCALGSSYDGWDGYGSAPDDWIEQLKLSGLQFAISPLHDKDVHEDDNSRLKKPHYHVIVVYGSPTTFNNVKHLTDSFNSPIPKYMESVRGLYRYLTHKDNPDKFQYDEADIVTGGGFNIADFIELSKSEVNAIKFKLQKLIREERITEYFVFMNYVQDNLDMTYYDVASSHTIFFNTYIKSIRHIMLAHNVDPETGEVLGSDEKGGDCSEE